MPVRAALISGVRLVLSAALVVACSSTAQTPLPGTGSDAGTTLPDSATKGGMDASSDDDGGLRQALSDASVVDSAASSGETGVADSGANDAGPAKTSDAAPTSPLVSFQPFDDGGQVECTSSTATTPMCAWATTQSSPSPFSGNSEIAACPVSYASGLPACTASPTCLTCNQEFYNSTAAAPKGQPRWFPDGVHLAFWVGNPTLTTTDIACRHVTPGAGCNGDLWTGTVTGATNPALDAASLVQWTTEVADQGVLFPTMNGSYISYSERFGDGDGSAPQSLGCWREHVFNYQVSNGMVVQGDEIAGSPFTPVSSCVWMENSGFFDPVSGELVVTANAPTSPWWQPQLYAINLTTGAANPFVDWGTTQSDCPWNEHVHVDPTGEYVTWASSHGNGGFGGYNGCEKTIFPGNPPLDLYRAKILRTGSGSSMTVTADEGAATRLTTLNVLGSADRTEACTWLGVCANSGSSLTTFSGGYGNWPVTGAYVWLIKTSGGDSAIATQVMLP